MRGARRKNRLLTAAILSAATGVAHSADPAQPEGTDQPLEIVVLAKKIGSGETRAVFTLGQEDIVERPLGADITQILAKAPGARGSFPGVMPMLIA